MTKREIAEIVKELMFDEYTDPKKVRKSGYFCQCVENKIVDVNFASGVEITKDAVKEIFEMVFELAIAQ